MLTKIHSFILIIQAPESISTEDVVDFSRYEVAADSIIAYLVKNGADPNAHDAYGSAPLHLKMGI